MLQSHSVILGATNETCFECFDYLIVLSQFVKNSTELILFFSLEVVFKNLSKVAIFCDLYSLKKVST